MTASPETAHALLRAAGLELPTDEAAKLAAAYPAVRAHTDLLYAVGGYDPAPALMFDPTFP
jgi:hypothetical protein